jgi:hypothetical protein
LDGLVGIYHVPVHQENEDRRVVVQWVVQWVVVQWLFNGIIKKNEWTYEYSKVIQVTKGTVFNLQNNRGCASRTERHFSCVRPFPLFV